jgi:hypothetical protein
LANDQREAIRQAGRGLALAIVLAPMAHTARRMLERKPVKVVAVALANRMARVVWALIKTGDSYRARTV